MRYDDILNEESENTPMLSEPIMSTVSSLRKRIIAKVQVTTEVDDLYDCLNILQTDDMPCGINEDDLDAEIELAMNSGNATKAEVNKVFTRWMH